MKIERIFAVIYIIMGIFVLSLTIPRPGFEHWNIVLGIAIIILGIIRFINNE